MAQLFNDNSLSIGRTPLVRLNHVIPSGGGATVYAKVEGRNPPIQSNVESALR